MRRHVPAPGDRARVTDGLRRRVVIAGGGTAGWIAAAALVRHLGPLLDITLVESDEIGTVGVGESTIPTARTFHQLLGLNQREWMREAGASFKLGISFEGWGREGDRYFHAFGSMGRSTWMGDFHHLWLRARELGFGGSLDDYSLELQAAAARRFGIGEEEAGPSYAFHLDAGRYAFYLRRLAEAAGVTRIEGRIGRVRQAPSGDVAALVLQDGREIAGDLFVDCTGFRALLIGETLGVGYEDWGHWLPTNRAIAVQTRSVEPAIPCTRAIAHRAGWRWRIPLQHRVGNGIVFAADHMDEEEARRLLLESVAGEVLTDPRVIRYRTGRRLRSWERNVVALGLSGGFVEPLESTSIHLIMIGVTRLIQSFPFAGDMAARAGRFNAMADHEIERIRDFIILHYHLTERDDSDFWRRMRTMEVPESLRERIALFAESGQAYQAAEELFRVDSWVQVMLGQRLQPRTAHPMGHLFREADLRGALADIRAGVAAGVAKLPDHQTFLDAYCGAS